MGTVGSHISVGPLRVVMHVPSDDEHETGSRRRFLAAAGTGVVALIAGCSGGDGGGGTASPTPTPTPTSTPTPTEGDDGGDGGEVPESEATATALGGQKRNPDQLSSQEAVSYQDQPKDGQQCSGCTYYITDKNGDGKGACAIVEGVIDPEGWCVSYVAHEG